MSDLQMIGVALGMFGLAGSQAPQRWLRVFNKTLVLVVSGTFFVVGWYARYAP